MRQALMFVLIAAVISGAGLGYNALFPPAAKHYKIVYFGAGNCGGCQQWRMQLLPDWKRSEAAADTRLVIKEVRYLTQLSPESFGAYNDVWKKVGAGAKGVPAFALIDLETNRVAATYHGVSGWKALSRRLIAIHRRMQKRQAEVAVW